MPDLSVSEPILEYKAIADGVAPLEDLIQLRSAAVFPDGTAFDQHNLGMAGVFIYRQENVASTDIWNEEQKKWEADPGAAVGGLKPRPLIFIEGKWQTPMVAAGQKDKFNLNVFEKASGDLPRYFFRAYFATERDGISYSGLSAATSPLVFASLLDSIRAGIRVGENEQPINATEVVMFLRTATQQYLGTVEIISEGTSARIEISNREGGPHKAIIRLTADGDIEIKPKSGRKIILDAPILYQPSTINGTPVGPKKFLLEVF